MYDGGPSQPNPGPSSKFPVPSSSDRDQVPESKVIQLTKYLYEGGKMGEILKKGGGVDRDGGEDRI